MFIEWKHDRPGVALVTVLLVLLVVGALSTAAALVSSNVSAIDVHDARQSILELAADAGLEEARARINGNQTLSDSVFLPLDMRTVPYTIIENGVQVTDASGRPIPGIRRYTYAGPTGATSGQYGVFASIVTVVEDRNGDRVIRRRDIVQESFAKFAYFTDREKLPDGREIVFGGGDQIQGPVHSNDVITISTDRNPSVQARFMSEVTTAQTIRNANRAVFEMRGMPLTNQPVIPLPRTSDLERLRTLSQPGRMEFASTTGGPEGQARIRIEFDTLGDRGFIKVYQAAHDSLRYWVTADRPPNYNSSGLEFSRNCGDFHSGVFIPMADHGVKHYITQDWHHTYNSSSKTGRCFLGGSDVLNGGFKPADTAVVRNKNNGQVIRRTPLGSWLRWDGQVSDLVKDSGRPDWEYLHPISRDLNPNFRGVIFVNGNVAISGVVRGHVTVAATGDIIIADNIKYAIDPGSNRRVCSAENRDGFDILGLFAGGRILIADNTINSPFNPTGKGNSYFWFKEPAAQGNLYIHGTLLSLNNFSVVNYDKGRASTGGCGPGGWGRGCINLTGGIIQANRGPVGQASGTGFQKRYSYDPCVRVSPPPYFPTTGWSSRNQYVEIDPVGFNIDDYFAGLAQ